MSGGRRLRVAVCSELPTPYRWPVFERLLERDDLDLRILFCARREKDRQWEFDFRPDARVRFLPSHTASFSGRRTIHYHVNPTVFGELRRGRYDVVVLPGYAMFASQAGSLWCRANRVPYVLFSETTLLGRRPAPVRWAKRVLLPRLVGGASAWLATGKLAREYLLAYGAAPERIFRFPNTPDTEWLGREADRWRGRRAEVRRRLGAGEGPAVLFVGRLLGVKRCDLLLAAVGRLEGEPEVWIVGDGPEREGLEETAAREGLRRVRFLGNLASAELPSLYASADVFVLPSDHEPWGAVVCEAAACGLPLVVSDGVGAGPDLVREGESGVVFPRGDAGALTHRLERLLSDPGERQRMGGRSREVAGAFTHRECVEEFVACVRAARRRD